MAIEDYGSRLANDARALDELRHKARANPREALKGAAQQFEAYFVQIMMKSMRETLSQDGMFDNEQTRFYTGMLDQQMGQQIGGKGAFGFASMLERQLGQSLPESSAGAGLPSLPQRPITPAVERVLREWRESSATVGSNPLSSNLQKNALAAAQVAPAALKASDSTTPKAFASTVWPHAVAASASTGIAPNLLVAHAALESGWGKSEPKRPDGSSSFNLFGIKAGKSWTGPIVEALTTEYEQGKPVTRTERFRAYGSYKEAFEDYASLLSNSSRYSSVLASQDGTDFANSLQKSGYATDPMYAAKLARIINGKTLRDALIG